MSNISFYSQTSSELFFVTSYVSDTKHYTYLYRNTYFDLYTHDIAVVVQVSDPIRYTYVLKMTPYFVFEKRQRKNKTKKNNNYLSYL